MDLEFQNKPLTYLQNVVGRPQTQEQTQEVRLPEGMPDIGNVVTSWAQVILRGKEWRGDRVGVNGGVMVWVMYLPEEENIPQAVSAWIPFQMKWDIPQTRHDGTLLASPFLRSVDARSLSARKLMVRTTFGVSLDGMVPEEVNVFHPGEVPEDLHLLKKTYPCCLPTEAGEKPFELEECFTLPANMPEPERIIRCCLEPMITEWKMMADKLVFRGHGQFYMLYRCKNGQLHSWQQQMPFSQYGELDQEYDDSCAVKLCPMVTELEADLTEAGQLCIKSGISVQFVIFKEHKITLVEDSYSCKRDVEPKIQALFIPSLLDRQLLPFSVEQTVEADAAQVLDLTLYMDEPQKTCHQDRWEIRLPGSFSLLYLDPEGNYQSTNAYWEESMPLPAEESAKIQATATMSGLPMTGMSSNGVSMQADLQLDLQTTAGQGIPMVTDLELGEERPADPDRPSLILRRATGNDLWHIAKESGADLQAIREANGLEGDPEPGQMLLIPIL